MGPAQHQAPELRPVHRVQRKRERCNHYFYFFIIFTVSGSAALLQNTFSQRQQMSHARPSVPHPEERSESDTAESHLPSSSGRRLDLLVEFISPPPAFMTMESDWVFSQSAVPQVYLYICTFIYLFTGVRMRSTPSDTASHFPCVSSASRN